MGFAGAVGQADVVELEVLVTEAGVDVVLSEVADELEVELVEESDDEAEDDAKLDDDEEMVLLAVRDEDKVLVVQVLVREDEGTPLHVPNPKLTSLATVCIGTSAERG